MVSDSYILRTTGWGYACPEGFEVKSKEECLSAAKTLLVGDDDDDHCESLPGGGGSGEECFVASPEKHFHSQQQQEELEVFDNTWEYPPCGCFIWKNGHRVIFADPDDNDNHNGNGDGRSASTTIKQCRANQWAQLICKEGEVEKYQVKDMNDPTLYDYKRTPELDWVGFKPLRFWQNHRFCVGTTKDKNGALQASIKLCSDIELKDIEHWSYSLVNKMCIFDDFCFLEIQTDDNGESDDPALKLGSLHDVTNKMERWYFNSDGRFQSSTNPDKYISVAGCEVKEGATLEISSLKDNCGQQFMQYIRYDVFNVSTKDICYVVIPFTIVFAFQLMFVILYFQRRWLVGGGRAVDNSNGNARIENILRRRRAERRRSRTEAETIIETHTYVPSSPLRENESVHARR